jgi:tRNA(adenine34) deaminase
MHYAMALADKAGMADEVPVGAVLVRDGQVLGEGWNRPIGDHDPSAHAEIIALRNAGQQQGNYRLPGSTLYVTIEPCLMCAGAIVHARVERLVFGAMEPKAGAVCSHYQVLSGEHLNHRVEVVAGVEAQACSDLISAFFKRRRLQKKADKKGVRG